MTRDGVWWLLRGQITVRGTSAPAERRSWSSPRPALTSGIQHWPADREV